MSLTHHIFKKYLKFNPVVNLDPAPDPLHIFLLRILTENKQIFTLQCLTSKEEGCSACRDFCYK